jgi:hypothetical protein
MDSRYERNQLRKIERWFEHDDPDLVTVMRGGTRRPRRLNRRPVRLGADLAGCALVVAGVLASALLLIFAGILVLMTAWCLHTTSAASEKRRNSSN